MPTAIIRVTIAFAEDGTLSGFGGCNDTRATPPWTARGSARRASPPGSQASADATSKGIQDGLLQVMPFIDTWSIVDGELHLDSSFGIETTWAAQ